MKMRYTLLTAILGLFVLASCNNQPKEHKGTVAIKESAGNSTSGEALAYQAFDVVVYHSALADTMQLYTVAYFQTEDNAVKKHGGIYSSANVYTKAEYNWQADTVTIKLLGADSVKPASFRLYGHGSSNGMMDVK